MKLYMERKHVYSQVHMKLYMERKHVYSQVHMKLYMERNTCIFTSTYETVHGKKTCLNLTLQLLYKFRDKKNYVYSLLIK